MLYQIVAQAIGFIAAIILGLGFLQKKKSSILIFNIIASLFFVVHYYMLDGLTGALCNLPLASLFIYLYEKYSDKRQDLKIGLALAITYTVAVPGWQDVFSIFPIAASTFLIIGLCMKKPQTVRLYNIIGAFFWLAYAVIIGSWSVIISELIIIACTAVALWKYSKK